MIDVLAPVTHIAFIRAPLIGDNHIRVTVKQQTRSAEKRQVGGEWRVTIQKAALIQSQQFGTNGAADDDGIRSGHITRYFEGGAGWIQHHARKCVP